MKMKHRKGLVRDAVTLVTFTLTFLLLSTVFYIIADTVV